MINHLTISERNKIHEITGRLANMHSPVLRLQAILQFSQIVDILTLGDTGQADHEHYMNSISELEDKVNEYEETAQANGNECILGGTPSQAEREGCPSGSSVACVASDVTACGADISVSESGAVDVSE
jgi:hypothetical protein